MGGAVSSGESNDDLIDNLLEADYIKSPMVERVFRAVDRAEYYTEGYKSNAYKDLAWKDGNLHLSAPCIYSEVLENLDLQAGMCFLNIGSGTGYFSTMCGLILGKTGVNHGIELYSDVVDYAREKLEEFMKCSPAIDEFDFCPPEFTVGNCLDSITTSKRYDRIYCGAACPNTFVGSLVDMLKVGGICVVPIGDCLVHITRLEGGKDERKNLLPVSFATLISPRETDSRTPVELPELSPKLLTELCRSEIRSSLRQTINYPEPKSIAEDSRKKKRRKRLEERRRGRRLVVVQRRRSGGVELGEIGQDNGFVAVAYSMGSNSSDDEMVRGSVNEDRNQGGNSSSTTSSEDSSQEGDIVQPGNGVNNDNAIMDDANETQKVDCVAGPSSLTNKDGVDASRCSNHEEGSNGCVSVVTGSCNIYAVSNNDGRKAAATENGTDAPISPTRRNNSATAANRQSPNGTSQSRPTRRSYTTGAEALIGRIQQLVRARQQDLESMRRHFRRSGSGNNSGNGSDAGAESSEVPVVNQIDSPSSSDDSSPSHISATSTSDEDGADHQWDKSKKRCRHESSTNEDKETSKEPKPDPLLVNPCSVQMRRKIVELPLPPALKVYLNYDRKIQYTS